MGKVHVFEATNDRRRERFVAFTSEPLDEMFASFLHRPPTGITHWMGDDGVSYRPVEEGLPFEEACDFVERYAEIMRSAGWKMIIDLPRRYPDRPMGSHVPY